MPYNAIDLRPMTLGSNTKKLLFCFMLMAFVFGGFFGASHLGMDTQQLGGQMGPCPFMPGVVICNMTPLQHMVAAQSLFNVLPQQNDILSLLMIFLAAMIIAALLFRKKSTPVQSLQTRRFVVRSEYVPFPLALQEAFSNGIVHSKAF